MRMLKVLTSIMLMVFLFCPDAHAAQNSKMLEEKTRITPPGVIVAIRANIPMFKKGTAVILNDFGEVIEGTLSENIYLPYETGNSQNSVRATVFMPAPQAPIFIPQSTPVYPPVFIPYIVTDATPQSRVLSFKGGTKVVFNDRGEVVKGTVSTRQTINLNPANHISVSEGEISFHPNGMVATCTLAKDSYLRPVGWTKILTDNFTEGIACSGFIEFKGGKPIELNDKGEVVKGTLNNDTQLFFDDSGVKGLHKAGTTVEFNDKGAVAKVKEL